MGATHQYIKLSALLVEAARREGALFSARLGRAFEAVPGFSLDRVRAALAGELDAGELSEDEWRLFDDIRFDAIAQPDNEANAFFEALRTQAGAVGYDEEGGLVRVREDGSTEVIG